MNIVVRTMTRLALMVFAVAGLAFSVAASGQERESVPVTQSRTGVLATTQRMSGFIPVRHGFRFQNDFKNNVNKEFNIKTEGLCGGMAYAALDYFVAGIDVPGRDYRPAEHTQLRKYIYDRQRDSIRPNLDKWTEVRFNPGGARNAEFFEWGLRGFDGGRLEELRHFLDQRKPVPLGLKGANDTGDHQVLAIGYDLGRYKGDLGAHKGDLKIFVYDPNYPGARKTLVPDIRGKFYKYAENPGINYITYFVDRKYQPKRPPRITDRNYPSDGRAHELVVEFFTGGDDLRGGDDNVNVTIVYRDGHRQVVRNVNRGYRWIDHYNQFIEIPLDRPVPVAELEEIVLDTTFGGGVGGDNWKLSRLTVTARGGNVNEEILRVFGSPVFRFTGDRRHYAARLDTVEIPRGYVSELIIDIVTGSDDLRGGNDNLDVSVLYADGSVQLVRNINSGTRWGDHESRRLKIILDRPVPPDQLRGLRLYATLSGGVGGDNWNMRSIEVQADGNLVKHILYKRDGRPLYRFTGDNRRFDATF